MVQISAYTNTKSTPLKGELISVQWFEYVKRHKKCSKYPRSLVESKHIQNDVGSYCHLSLLDPSLILGRRCLFGNFRKRSLVWSWLSRSFGCSVGSFSSRECHRSVMFCDLAVLLWFPGSSCGSLVSPGWSLSTLYFSFNFSGFAGVLWFPGLSLGSPGSPGWSLSTL